MLFKQICTLITQNFVMFGLQNMFYILVHADFIILYGYLLKLGILISWGSDSLSKLSETETIMNS